MKKIIVAMLCVGMAITLNACSKHSDEPKVVANLFLEAYLKKDEEKIKEYSEWKDYNVKALKIQNEDYIEGVDRTLQKEVYDMMMDFDHKEKKESIKDDHATVTVELTIYDFEAVTQKGLEEATKKAEELSEDAAMSDAKAQAEISKILFTNMKEAKKTKKQDVVINLKKVSGKWIVSNDNADIQNILTNNMQSLQSVEE